MKAKYYFVMLVVIVLFMISGCSKTGEIATPTPDSSTGSFKPVVNATGVVIPGQWAVLSSQTSGVVTDVMVVDGEAVNKDQLLLQLVGTESAQARVAAASLELADAQNAYDSLVQNAAALAAASQSDIVRANDIIVAAERALDEFEKSSYLNKIKDAERDVDREKDQLETAQQNFDNYADRPETDSTRKFYTDKLADQQRDYESAVRDLQELVNQKEQAKADLATGQALLETATQDYEKRKDGPSESDTQLAQARLDNAKAQFEAAKNALAQLSLTAPFAGTISNPKVRVGELVTPGQPLMYISDATTLQVETTDLNEIDVARLSVGDSTVVSFDALPEVTVNGKVASIATKSSEGSGVNYTVTISLDEVPEKLLWGMTAFVDIFVEK